MTTTRPFQPSLDNLDVRQDASLDDFSSFGYKPIITAVNALYQGQLQELYIIGDKGVGKTHLAMAITDKYTTYGKTVICVSLIDMINSDDGSSALMGLESFDLIILDDIQAVSQSDEWQEALFHLINRIRKDQKQLIFIADNPAKELGVGLLDLLTRLSLAPAMRMPDGEAVSDRQAILHSILRRKNWRLPDEIFEYLLYYGPWKAGDIVTVLNQIAPLLTHLSRVQVSKKTTQEIKQIIDEQTLFLEIDKYIAVIDEP